MYYEKMVDETVFKSLVDKPHTKFPKYPNNEETLPTFVLITPIRAVNLIEKEDEIPRINLY